MTSVRNDGPPERSQVPSKTSAPDHAQGDLAAHDSDAPGFASADVPERAASESPQGLGAGRGDQGADVEVAHSDASADLTPVVGSNLRRLRTQHGLSLERLAKASGVSRAMLGQIELGQSTPTINVLWKISSALGVPFSALISARSSGSVHVLRGQE